ncbi:MAG: hypothetical protein OEV35_00225 [Gallionellaceae bacterium]|nr:hypothetical protein [Gallionellaceae bacterium]
MNYDVSIEVKDTYLYVVVSGEESLDSVISIWKKIAETCRQTNIQNIVCHGFLEGPGPVNQIYEFGKMFNELGIPAGARIALVCQEHELRKIEFAEYIVAKHAPVSPRIFRRLKEAEEWVQCQGHSISPNLS